MDKLSLPALRAHMGDWVYYLTFMRMHDIAEKIKIAEEIHTTKTLTDFIQRQLETSTRVKQIKDYLLQQPQRFFNALVVGVYGGSPQWYELGIVNNQLFDIEDIPLNLSGALGFLFLSGDEKLFALDGQHRVTGIREAIQSVRNDNPLNDEEVSVIFLAHRNTSEGMTRTRRLFTTLNRYAKPVSKKDIIALDEDDLVAIATRKLAEDHPLFRNKISTTRSKNIPTTDEINFTSIIALYDSLDIYLKGSTTSREWNKLKHLRPADDKLDHYISEASTLWDQLSAKFDCLAVMANSAPEDKVARIYRNADGGDLWFRPVGLLLLTKVITTLEKNGYILDAALEQILALPRNLAEEPWSGLLWDAINQRMITAPQNQDIALKLTYYAIGGDLSHLRTTDAAIKNELAGVLNKEEGTIVLPKYD